MNKLIQTNNVIISALGFVDVGQFAVKHEKKNLAEPNLTLFDLTQLNLT